MHHMYTTHMHMRHSNTHKCTLIHRRITPTHKRMHTTYAHTPYQHLQCTRVLMHMHTHHIYTTLHATHMHMPHTGTHTAHEAPHITSTPLDSRQGPGAEGPGSRGTGQASPSAHPAPGAQDGKAVLACPLGSSRHWAFWPWHSNGTHFGSCFMYFAGTQS